MKTSKECLLYGKGGKKQESSPQETDLVRWYHIEMHLDKEQIEELKKHLRKKYGHFLIKLSEMKNDNSF